MKCPNLNEGFGFPECYSIFEKPLYPLEFRYDGYCIKENHINCPFYQAGNKTNSAERNMKQLAAQQESKFLRIQLILVETDLQVCC